MTRREALKPWQRMPDLSCSRCDLPATRRCVASDLVIDSVETMKSGALLAQTSTPDLSHLAAALTCEEHADQVTGELCEEYGVAYSDGIRDGWGFWLMHRFPPTRWTGKAAVAIHNWRFDRDLRSCGQ